MSDWNTLHDLCIPPGGINSDYPAAPPVVTDALIKHALHPDSARFYEILREVATIHARKQADYGTPDAPFANLEASEEFGIPAWLGILVRMNDKISRLKTYAKTRKLANEGVIDNANDLAVYAIALRIAFEKAAK